MECRDAFEEVLFQIHHLYIQYGDEEIATNGGAQTLKIDQKVLTMEYILGVTGQQGGLDKDARRTAMMTLYALLKQDPLMQGDLGKWWYVLRAVIEEFERADAPSWIGTQPEAVQKMKQMQEAAQKQHDEEMQLQILSHSKDASKAAPKPGAQQQAPQGQPPPGAPAMNGAAGG
jgi:hypothetical protein